MLVLATDDSITPDPQSATADSTAPGAEDSCCCTCCFAASSVDSIDDITNSCGSCEQAAANGDSCPHTNLYTTTKAPTTTTPTPPPDEEEPQKINGSRFPERIQPREDFLQEEKLTETLAELPLENKQSLGFTKNDLILDCKYSGHDCSLR